VTGFSHSWTYPVNSATGVQETINYDSTPLTSVAINRDSRDMETSRVATIATNNMVTWAIADPTGRDNADRWTSATLQQTGGTQLTESRSFDGAGRLSTQSGAGYTSGNSATYTYDSGPGGVNSIGTGLLDYETLPLLLGGTVTEGTSSSPITYDANQRISTATVNGVAGSYTFDSAGNLKTDTEGSTTTNFTYNSANQLTQSVTGSATTVYGWDTTNAWRTSQGPSSNPTQVQYAYNAQGRMKSYTNSATGVSASYTYDAAGQRTQSPVTVSGVTTTTSWVYDGLTLMSQQVVRGSNSWRIDYLYNEDDTPIGGVYRSPANSTSPTFFAIITDSHSDVCELLDTNGNAFAAYHYDAWGLPQGPGNYATGIWTASTSLISSTLAGQIGSEQVLRFASYVYDPESGLYYCSARYYDPVTRQWTTADAAKADGEESAYQYCEGNSIGNIDPTGTYTYSPSNAVSYASKWYYRRNSAYDTFPGDDCTNFVSQCLCYGGWPMTGSDKDSASDWFSDKHKNGSFSVSISWSTCQGWWNFAVKTRKRAIPRATQWGQHNPGNNACGGDVLVWITDYGRGHLLHLMLVASHHGGDPLLYEHGDHDNKGLQPFPLTQAYRWMKKKHPAARAWAIRIPPS
jgi:RHS repeat-associated protein